MRNGILEIYQKRADRQSLYGVGLVVPVKKRGRKRDKKSWRLPVPDGAGIEMNESSASIIANSPSFEFCCSSPYLGKSNTGDRKVHGLSCGMQTIRGCTSAKPDQQIIV
jgi:hypothetical protein